MIKMIKKVLNFEVKEVSPRVLEFVGSTEDKDRMGDIIVASGWQLKNYKKNPVFLWAHQYDLPPIGKAIKVWIEDDRLKFHIQFAEKDEYEFADTIYKLYKGGYLRATSVGFMPIESEPIEIKEDNIPFHTPTRYLKQDLLELSACPVPANPNALAEARTKGLISTKDEGLLVRDMRDSSINLKDALNKVEKEEKPYPNEHACRLRSPDDFQEDSFRRMEREHEGKKYSVIMGRLKGEDTMTEQAYRYNKEIWTSSQAKRHCLDHGGTFESASEENTKNMISQQEIADEIDYLLTCIKSAGLSDKNKKMLWGLVDELIRLSGSDIPVEIIEKITGFKKLETAEVLEIIQTSIQNVVNQALEKYGGKKWN